MIVFLREYMKTVILLSLLGYASTAASHDPSPRSVNVALETSFLFEPKNIRENIKFVKNIKDFLDKLYAMLAPQLKDYNTSQNPTGSKQFRADTMQQIDNRRLDFLVLFKEVCYNMANASSSTFDHALSIIKEEMYQIIDTNQYKLNEIIPDENLKKIIKDSFDKLHNTTYNVKHCHRNPIFKRFAKKMDRIYSKEDLKKLLKYLRKFNKAIDVNSKLDASRIVKEFIQFGVIDKYNDLNVPGKNIFIKETGLLLDYIRDKNKEYKSKHHDGTSSKKMHSTVPAKQIVFAFDDATNSTSLTNMDTRRSRGDKEKNVDIARPKKDRKRSGNNEIIVDNIELIVQSLKS
ncbi:uncharacterized protein LOC111361026 [Spodoptera litura]|uniref:Uncharacterized protein LOC111361026 n=1 Tax=Spodoptera litura TaxID=69820 RepID=A0A9J7ER39_SPOLT|nr:uncharacterized protein LOC111361026 [Spodoptera litura]